MTVTALKEVQTLLGGETFPKVGSPSLRLEKFVRLGENSKKDEIASVVACHAKHRRQIPSFAPAGSVTFTAALGGRLIVNQAGGILENAGLCLHRHFGDPYIPGSAVKGIARHAAWLAWSAAEGAEKAEIAQQMCRVFGYPTGDKGLDQFVKQHALLPQDILKSGRSGSVCFLQAVPEGKVSLAVDILTPHGGNDWSDPIPSPFPAVEKGATFRFVMARKTVCLDGDLCQAATWLKHALCYHGAGAKGAAGYGWFASDGLTRDVKNTLTVPLKLVSPAFLRGATDQSQGELREATLRGLLRWWWRYLYRSVLVEKDVKKLEGLVWGDASGQKPQASKIVLRLVRAPAQNRAMPFDKQAKARQMPRQFEQNRTSGIEYLSYGMDERVRGETRRRSMLEPGAEWKLEISTRPCHELSSEQLLAHAQLALQALCTYGGVGSRARKGFGSLDCGQPLPEDDVLFNRLFASLNGSGIGTDDEVENPYSLLTAIRESITVRARDAWQILDRVGFALQRVATDNKHQSDKAVLGLPRQIHGPRRDPLLHQRAGHTPPVQLRGEGRTLVTNRLASPLCVHLTPVADGFRVNLTAFPSGLVRSQSVSERLLRACIDEITVVLSETFK